MPNWNFRQLYYGVCEDVRETTLTDFAKRWSNEVAEDVMSRQPWSFAKREGHLLTTADTMVYSLPSHWDNITDFRQKDSLRNMRRYTGAQFHEYVRKPTSSGEPYCAVYFGIVGYNQTPESLISFVSSSAADTGTIALTGISGGWEQSSQTITLTGITAVSSTKRYSRIISAVASAAVTGAITITDDASRTLATIAAAGTTATISSQPASKLAVSSSSTSDDYTSDVTQYMSVRGYSGDEVFLEEKIQLDGTASVSSTNYFNRFEEICKYTEATGIITCTSNGGNKTVAKIAPNELKAEYIQVGFYWVPNAAYDIEIRYSEKAKEMIQDSDSFHPIPAKYFGVLKNGVLMRAWDYLKYPRKSGEAEARYERGLQEMWRDDCRRVATQTRVQETTRERVLFTIARNAG